MKIAALNFAALTKANNAQSHRAYNQNFVSFAGEKNDIFEKSELSYRDKIENALNSLQGLQTNKINETKAKLDKLGFEKVSLESPKEIEEYKNGKLFREIEVDSPSMITQVQYNEDGKEEFFIICNKNLGHKLLRITALDKDGLEGSTIAYKDGKINSCKIYLKDKAKYEYKADANKHGILNPDHKGNIIFSRFLGSGNEDPYYCSRIEHSTTQNGLNGQLFISKDNDEAWWFDHSGQENEEITFEKDALKDYDMDSAFDEVNSLMAKIVPSEARTKEINEYFDAVFNLV